ncbi:hypothetical protein E2C01_004784 [Portunus trituberculatus]|uniref:Uncharacterized protein n=1 Tax=Portunus trituberculatus TaxID=210409 RepID=A0A5B7CUU8_PORTR|nr:hypothetical protein [Portunus trituberculatus]
MGVAGYITPLLAAAVASVVGRLSSSFNSFSTTTRFHIHSGNYLNSELKINKNENMKNIKRLKIVLHERRESHEGKKKKKKRKKTKKKKKKKKSKKK